MLVNDKKIFNNSGFLSIEGKVFVNDGFAKEVKKVLDTSTSTNDVLIIASILKSIVDEQASSMKSRFLNKEPAPQKIHNKKITDIDNIPYLNQ